MDVSAFSPLKLAKVELFQTQKFPPMEVSEPSPLKLGKEVHEISSRFPSMAANWLNPFRLVMPAPSTRIEYGIVVHPG